MAAARLDLERWLVRRGNVLASRHLRTSGMRWRQHQLATQGTSSVLRHGLYRQRLQLVELQSTVTPNNSFKPKLLRGVKGMADTACHAFATATQFGLTQVLGPVNKISYEIAKERTPSSSEFIGVDFSPDDPVRPFWVWSGVGYHTHAARISASEFLSAWPEHFALVGPWLEPILVQLASGNTLIPADVLLAYATHHGQEAPVASTGA